MTSIITSNTLGLFNSSLNVLGAGFGSSSLGRFGEQVYVNGATGNLVLQNQDELLVGLGPDASLVRTYNSQGLMNDENGDNWRLNIAALFNIPGTPNSAGSSVSKRFGDGSEVIYTYDSTVGSATYGKYVSTDGDGAHDTLSFSSSEWTWTDGSGRNTEVYNSSGQLTKAKDVDGNTRDYTYTSGLLTRIDTASTGASANEYVEIVYSGNNITELRSVTSTGTQTKVRYAYDTSNRLSQVIVDLTPENGVTLTDSNSDGLYETVNNQTYVTTYTYDGTSTRVASITQGDGTATSDTTVSFIYTNVSGLYKISTITDGEGKVTNFSYDTTNRITTVTDPLSQATTYKYDGENKLLEVTTPNGIVTAYGYDGSDNLTSVTRDPSGLNQVVTYNYDASGNLTLTRDAAGNTVTRTYNGNNQLVTETAYLVADPDGSGSAQPGTPITARYAYDAENHLRFTVSAEGRVTEHRYNTAAGIDGTRSSSLAYTGAAYSVGGLNPTDTLSESTLATWAGAQDLTKLERTDYAYDVRGQVSTATTYETTNSSGIGTGTPAVTHYVYDQRGQLLQTLDARNNATPDPANSALANATTYTYDGLGRVLSAIQWVSATDTPQSRISLYDDVARTVKVALANGLATTSVYDKRGFLTSVIQSVGAQTLGTTTYQYDNDGNMRIVTDPAGVKAYSLYDSNDRLIATISAAGELAEVCYDRIGRTTKSITYATRLTGTQLASLVDGSGNPNGSVTLSSVRPASSADDRITRTVYNSANQAEYVISATDTGSTTGYVTRSIYDGAGRLTDVVRYATAINTTTLSSTTTSAQVASLITADANNDRLVRYFYDADSKLIGSLDGEGFLTETKYNAAGEVVEAVRYATAAGASLWATGSFSSLKTNVGTNASDQHSYSFYNARGQVIGSLDAENFLTEFAYDLAGNVIQQTRYVVHANSFTGTPTLSGVRPSSTGAHIRLTEYNGANQVTQVTTNPNGTITKYSYDNVGNLIRADQAYNTAEVRTTRARYDVQGRLLQELTGEGSIALDALGGSPTQIQIDAVWTSYGLTHTYDASGRRTSTTDQNNHKTLFYYDSDGRLNHTVNALGEVAQTIYNAFGQVQETVRYTTRISTSGLNGGLAANDATFTSRLATAANSSIDSHTQTNYTLRGAVKSAVDALNVTTGSYTYNAFGELATRRGDFSAATDDYALDTYSYDRRGLLKQTIEDTSHGSYTGLARSTAKTYDAFGRLKTVTDGNGNPPVSYNYTIGDGGNDKVGRVITLTDALGHSSVTQYDAFGRVLKVLDRLNQPTIYTYDDANRSVTVTTPEGITVTTVTNRHGETATITEGTGVPSVYTYDKNGNLTSAVQASGTLNLTTSTSYDHANLVLTTTDARGTVTSSFTYDAVNRVLTRAFDPSGLNIVSSSSYDGQGRSLTVTDANGTPTTYSYDQNGRVIQVAVDPSGLNLRTSFIYDRQGNTVSVTQGVSTSEARTTSYVFDHLGRRTEEHLDPNGQNLTTTYVYDQNDNLIAKREGVSGANALRTTRFVYDANNRLTYSVDGAGAVAKSEYDYEGRVIKTTRYANVISLSGFGNAISATDVAARVTTNATDQVAQYAYDNDGRLRFTVDGLRGLTETQYDAANRVTRQIRYANILPSNIAVSVLAIQAQLGSLADAAADQTTRTVYDAAGRALFSINTLNQVHEYCYDGNGNVVRSIAYATAITLPNPVNETTVRSAVNAIASLGVNESTRTVYDKANRAVFNIDALNYVTKNIYDKNGNIIRTIAYAVAITLPGTVNETTIGSAVAPLDVDTNNRSTRIVYDASGRAVFSVDVLGYAKKSVYDALGQVTSTVAYANKITATLSASPTIAEIVAAITISSAYDQVTSYGYDKAGRTTSTTDAANNSESYGYDALGNKTSFTNKLGSIWTYQYDAAGHLKQETSPAVKLTTVDPVTLVATTSAPTAIVTRMTYDAFGNVLTRTEGYGSTRPRTTTYVYDQLGRQIQTIFPVVGKYDTDSDVAADYIGPHEIDVAPTSTTYYDTLGNAVANQDVRGSFSYKVYDPLGRVKYAIDAERYVTEYGYDAFGNQLTVKRYANIYTSTAINTTLTSFTASGVATALINVASANDRVITNVYDVCNQLKETRQMAVYSYDSTVDKYFTYNPITSNIYNGFGQVIKQSVLRGLGSDNVFGNTDDQWAETYFYYDNDGRKTGQIDAKGYLTTYAYDALNNLTSQTEYAQRFTFVSSGSLSAGQYNASTYQATGFSLTASSASGTSDIGFDRTITYTYDRLNRKLSETRVGVQYTNAAFTPVLGNLSTNNTYDAVGNVTSVTDSTGAVVRTYYDALGRTKAVAQPARAVAGNSNAVPLTTFEYDVYGNLVHQTRYANAAQTADASTYAPGATSSDDQHSYTFFDIAGHAVRSVDAMGTSTYSSYDVAGNVAKRWQNLTDIDGRAQQVTTLYEYDRLGQQTAAVNVTRVPAPVLNVSSLGVTVSTVSATWGSYWSGTSSINLSWPINVDFGTGDVRVVVDYTARRDNGTTKSVVFDKVLNAGNVFNGYSVTWSADNINSGGEYAGLSSVERIQIMKMVNGEWVTLSDSPGTTTPVNYLSWGNDILPGADVTLEYRLAGATNWTYLKRTTDGTIQSRGSLYFVGLSGLSNGNYEYQLTYAGSGGTVSILQTTGTFSVGATTASGVVRDRGQALDITTTSNATWTNPTPYTTGGWQGSSSINLGWSTFSDLGSGDIRVRVEYTKENGYGATQANVYDQTMVASSAVTGLTISTWSASGLNGSQYLGQGSVGRVQVWKNVGGLWIPVIDNTADSATNQVLITGLPTTAHSIELKYRSLGSQETYRSVSAGLISALRDPNNNYTGWFSISNNDLLNGAYEYILTAYTDDTHASTVSLVSIGGGANGILNGQMTVKQNSTGIPFNGDKSVKIALERDQARYNAFGEIVAKGANGWQEYFDYDNVGRQWRRNTDDGVTKVYLYNLAGQATSEIRSATVDLSTKSSAQEVTALAATSLRRTVTVYDMLGRAEAQVQPAMTQISGLSGAITVSPSVLGLVSISSAYFVPSAPYVQSGWFGSNGVALKWTSLDFLGTGAVEVRIKATMSTSLIGTTTSIYKTLTNITATGASLSWGAINSTDGDEYARLISVDQIEVWKTIDGVRVQVFNTTGDTSGATVLTWIAPPVPDTEVVFAYRAVGSTATYTEVRNTNGGPVQQRGPMYWLDLSSLPNDVYEYTLSYRRSGEATNYSSGSGTFVVSSSLSTTGSINVSGFVEQPTLNVTTTSANWIPPAPYVTGGWQGTSNINLTWAPLTAWGSGSVRVRVDYTVAKSNGSTTTGNKEVILSAADALAGGTSFFIGPSSSTNGNEYARLVSVNQIQLWKVVNDSNQELRIFNSTNGGNQSIAERLIIRGKTTSPNLSTVTIRNAAGTIVANNAPVTSLGNGIFSIDVSALAQGVYTCTPNGTTSSLPFSFGVKGASTLVSNALSVSDSVAYGPHVMQTLDRWGNVIASTDARNALWVTNYRYDYANHQIAEIKPVTDIWNEQGISLRTDANADNDRPTTFYAYDAAGRVVKVTDPNGNLNGGYSSRRVYDTSGNLISEIGTDNYAVQHGYDVLGREVTQTDRLNHITTRTYDRNNRLLTELSPFFASDQILTSYQYDEAGNRIRVTNGMNETMRYYYDARGNLILARQPLDGVSGARNYTYDRYDIHGKKVYELNGNFDGLHSGYDYFGRIKTHTDMGTHVTSYVYNFAGDLVTQTSVDSKGTAQQNISYEYYANGAVKRVIDNALHMQTSYDYDAAGHQTREVFEDTVAGTRYQDITVRYDELGRISTVNDFQHYDLTYYYDAAGNRRRILSNYVQNDGKSNKLDYWFKYDSMNRITLAEGSLTGGVIDITSGSKAHGTRLAYDGAGNRAQAQYYSNTTLYTDRYAYDDINRLVSVYKKKGSNPEKLDAWRDYDKASRVKYYYQYTYISDPSMSLDKVTRTNSTYNANGMSLTQDTWKDSYGALYDPVTHAYLGYGITSTDHKNQVFYNFDGAYDNAGNILEYHYDIYGDSEPYYKYNYKYEKWDSYKEGRIDGASPYFESGYSQTTYDVNGNIKKVYDPNASTNTRNFVVTTQGLILQKSQTKNNVLKTQNYYYVQGKQVGTVGDLSDADFSYNYTKVSSQYPSSSPSQYVIQSGDTLQSIAAGVFGDSGLWYLIADANGLDSTSTLVDGQTLTIPNSISNLHNNTDTFKVYNPREMIGDTTPNIPPPPGPAGCSGIAMILMVIVVIIVTIFTAGAAALAFAGTLTSATTTIGGIMMAGMGTIGAAGGVAAGLAAAAIGGAVGSIVQQGLMIATGHQDKFSWSAVGKGALSGAISAGVGAGLGKAGLLQQSTSLTTGQMVANAVITNAATQGVMILTGQQQKFSWASMAASAVGGAIDSGFGFNTDNVTQVQPGEAFSWSRFGERLADEGLKSLAHQVAVRYDTGGKISWEQVAGDAFGNSIVNSIVENDKHEKFMAERDRQRQVGNFGAGGSRLFPSDMQQEQRQKLLDLMYPEISDVPSASSPKNTGTTGSVPVAGANGKSGTSEVLRNHQFFRELGGLDIKTYLGIIDRDEISNIFAAYQQHAKLNSPSADLSIFLDQNNIDPENPNASRFLVSRICGALDIPIPGRDDVGSIELPGQLAYAKDLYRGKADIALRAYLNGAPDIDQYMRDQGQYIDVRGALVDVTRPRAEAVARAYLYTGGEIDGERFYARRGPYLAAAMREAMGNPKNIPLGGGIPSEGFAYTFREETYNDINVPYDMSRSAEKTVISGINNVALGFVLGGGRSGPVAQGSSPTEIRAFFGRLSNYGTGSLRSPGALPPNRINPGQYVLINGSNGLQTRTTGLFDNPIPGETYLWAIDRRGMNMVLEKTPIAGNTVMKHSNMTSAASVAGEAVFGPNNTVNVNPYSGRWGYTPTGGATAQQYQNAIRMWESLGYKVNAEFP